MIHFNMRNLDVGLHETPIKKGKDAVQLQPKTAESIEKIERKIQDIDPDIVKITEQEEIYDEEEEQDVERKLTYDSPNPKAKLFMSPTWSSMKKKSNIHYEHSHNNPVQSIVLFEITAEDTQNETPLPQVDFSKSQCRTPKGKASNMDASCWATRKKVDLCS